jgi:acyl-CoA thioesterase-1
MTIFKISTSIFALFVLSQLFGCGPRIVNFESKGKNIICFGNSITRGVGSTQGNDYPSLLSKKLNREVINAGLDGDTTEEAFNSIEADVLKRDPRLVIIELSGNDFIQGISPKTTFSNLDKMVAMIQQSGAMVVLVEVAAGHLGDEYLEGFKQIAKRRRALLIPNILGGIISNISLKSDEIHPNDEGYRLIAERIYKKIKLLLRGSL